MVWDTAVAIFLECGGDHAKNNTSGCNYILGGMGKTRESVVSSEYIQKVASWNALLISSQCMCSDV